ncbi:class-II fumarase/aspartase family protein [Paracoccus shanxieyensis]|uniref:Adenylosuccinate lyase family protein n=1 Tax=Paracoccus shanxieyensis TaxID=2675752 RepID=A0A6L6J0V4_9RHOB|nr:adenylosuccinate lyase family protein [Paracoccus shanxieyensis]MTH65531.1 adenylosuccinate lyase family protein [Paracoccus shanxieyensis]MTH88673.1 adenylosuccinate lyase family protein [Paracoccus shanxieyensis]
MPASIADSAIYRTLFSDDATAALFTDSAEIRAMLLVEGALARVQGQLGIIPETAAAFIDRAAREVQIDPAALAQETATNGVPIPGLVAAFRKAMQAPEHAQYLHWGATSQDIVETAQALRLRRVLELWDAGLAGLIAALGQLARTHADLPMAARTYGQAATPTSFGAVVAGWGHPLIRHRQALADLRPALATVSLGGAAGTLSAMGAEGPAVRSALAQALDLADPGHSWHAERDRMGALAAWMTGVTTSLAKMGEDLILMTQSGINEIRLEGAGGSSTMPQKQNPVGPSVLVALARQVLALSGAVQGAGVHRQQRDGAAWFVEWLCLPQLCISTGRAIALAADLATRISPDAQAMARGLDDGTGLIHAEAYTFALARHMPRPEAQARIKALCKQAMSDNRSLPDLVARDFPDLDLSAAGGLGTAPAEARAFAASTGA